MVKFFSSNIWQMMPFLTLSPLDALIPKIPSSFFADFWVWVTSKARGSASVGFWGSRQLSRGVYQGALSTPPPFQLKAQGLMSSCASPTQRKAMARRPVGERV